MAREGTEERGEQNEMEHEGLLDRKRGIVCVGVWGRCYI